MNKSILITRPNHDDTNNYLYYWSSLVIQEAHNHNLRVFDLASRKSNLVTFTSYVNKNHPGVLFFNGHGSNEIIAGYNDEPLLVLGKNEALCINSIVYARSCEAGNDLGNSLVKNGTKSYIGYKRNFVFFHNPKYITKPLHDKVAELFLAPSNLIPISLIKGSSAQAAYLKSISAMLKNIRRMTASDASTEMRSVVPFLYGNIKNQVILGDINALL